VHPERNSPEHLPAIGAALAQLRGVAEYEVQAAARRNAMTAIPRLADLLVA
jgi:TatD DNase family protein